MNKSLMIAAISGLAAGAANAQTVLLSEDFESLELFPFVSGTEGGGDGTDWTDILPDGWDFDNMDTPADGPVEFFGFTFLDKNSWIATAGDQARSTFERGEGTVMVADADEYDDAGDIDPDLFNVSVRTPAIDLSPVGTGLLEINFDSSFRPYPTMTGIVEVSFDDGASFDALLTLNDDTVPGGTSSLDRANEFVSLTVDIPAGATEAIVQWRMADAGNDWWWAIDNVEVKEGLGGPGPFSFLTDEGTVFEETTPLIEWTEAADAVDYDVVASLSEDLSDPAFEAEGITETSIEVGPINSGKYFVSVTANNSAGSRDITDGATFVYVINPCPGDFDGDGSLSIFDFLAFQNAFDAGCP